MKHLFKLLIWFQNTKQVITKHGYNVEEFVLYYNIY